MFTCSFKCSQTSLIIKELIKHENKFNRKAFHDREKSKNRFSEFSVFYEWGQKVYHEHFLVVYTMNYREMRIS